MFIYIGVCIYLCVFPFFQSLLSKGSSKGGVRRALCPSTNKFISIYISINMYVCIYIYIYIHMYISD